MLSIKFKATTAWTTSACLFKQEETSSCNPPIRHKTHKPLKLTKTDDILFVQAHMTQKCNFSFKRDFKRRYRSTVFLEYIWEDVWRILFSFLWTKPGKLFFMCLCLWLWHKDEEHESSSKVKPKRVAHPLVADSSVGHKPCAVSRGFMSF